MSAVAPVAPVMAVVMAVKLVVMAVIIMTRRPQNQINQNPGVKTPYSYM